MDVLTGMLLLLGAGFLVANARLLLEYLQFRSAGRGALLTWQGPKPPYYGMALAIGVALGFLVFSKLVISHQQAFGEIDDVPLLRLSAAAEPADRPRLLRGRHLGRLGLHPLQRGRRHQLARRASTRSR